MLIKWIRNLIVLIPLLVATGAGAQPAADASAARPEVVTVTVISADEKHWFWSMMIEVMKKAAQDLSLQLEIVSMPRDHLLYRKLALGVMARPEPPDYLIIGNEKESAAKIIAHSNGQKARIFLFNNGFVSTGNKLKFAQPGGPYPQWIGQLIPDNYQAGYGTAKRLIETLERTYPHQDLPILVMSGSFNTHASLERERGFSEAAAQHPRVKVLQRLNGEWSGDAAEFKTNFLLHRYPQTVGIWAANDELAQGAMRAAEKHGRRPGKDIFFTGCGWSKPAIADVASQRMLVSAGGHFLDGAWVLARLYDYQKKTDQRLISEKSRMFMMDQTNVNQIAKIMDKKQWEQFDFKKWTLTHNPRLKSYDEGLSMLLEL